MSERAYVLGTGADEFARLALQNRLWSDVAIHAWRRANLRIGDRVLDVGCGPGYAAADLSDIVTHHGRVVGVDESSTFVAQATSSRKHAALPISKHESVTCSNSTKH